MDVPEVLSELEAAVVVAKRDAAVRMGHGTE